MTPPQERLLAFSYLTAERAPLYRAILSVFVEARQRFALHLRPEEIDQAIEVPDTTKVESALRQLVEWGNLEAHQDTTEVATVEEFYRPRYLFQLTARGEAAEHAVRLYESELQQKGELKIAALQDVRALLNDLLSHARQEEPDPGKVFLTLQSLHARFEELTRRAQAFMRSLQRSIDLLALEEESLLAYKESLIEYLERFVRELVTSGSEIARSLDELDRLGVERLLE
ncbi:MAG: TIGR02677 family protein, partial [Planctomycetes bacterium]|nr:TIGR02677 family protein [Planctomycetota bacterium]